MQAPLILTAILAFADLPKLLALAAHDNVAVKISGACTLSHEPFPYKDIWDPLCRILDAFGFDRCMWGTDWTRAVGMLTYEQGVEAFRITDRLSDSERTALMGGVFRISGHKGKGTVVSIEVPVVPKNAETQVGRKTKVVR